MPALDLTSRRSADARTPATPPGRRPRLIALRGLPGSGKTTATQTITLRFPEARVVSMDQECRAALGRLPRSEVDEEVGRRRLRRIVADELRRGSRVIVDDINFKEESLDRLAAIASDSGADFAILDLWQEYRRQGDPRLSADELYAAWVELCIERDAARAQSDPTRILIGRDRIACWAAQFRDIFTRTTRHQATPLSALLAEED
jgi:hypothetical protein